MAEGLSYEARARASLEQNEFRFSKKLGQNFILDDRVMDAIAEAAKIEPGDAVLEIGPGAGSLTAAILRRGARVLAIEVDEALRPVLDAMLGGEERAEVLFADIRKSDIAQLRQRMEARGAAKAYRVAANLPYYITADVLTAFARSGAAFDSLTFMVQREAAERIMAQPGDKQYCLMSAMLNWKYDIEPAMELPRHLFTPQPHVDSTLLCFTPRPEPPARADDPNTLQRTMAAAFLMRRKTMANNICAAFSLSRERALEALDEAGLAAGVRGEALSQGELAALSNALHRIISEGGK